MRFLGDESCDFSVVKALRKAAYDVLCVSEISPRVDDTDVIKLAVQQKRILWYFKLFKFVFWVMHYRRLSLWETLSRMPQMKGA